MERQVPGTSKKGRRGQGTKKNRTEGRFKPSRPSLAFLGKMKRNQLAHRRGGFAVLEKINPSICVENQTKREDLCLPQRLAWINSGSRDGGDETVTRRFCGGSGSRMVTRWCTDFTSSRMVILLSGRDGESLKRWWLSVVALS